MPDQPPPQARPVYLTVPEVAAILRVSNMTIYRRLDDGDLRGYRFGRSVRIKARDLDDYIRWSEIQYGGVA